MNTDTPVFVLSFETSKGTFQWPFHVGTSPRVARQMAEERFKNPPQHRMPPGSYLKTVALMLRGRVYDCFDGSEWASDTRMGVFIDE